MAKIIVMKYNQIIMAILNIYPYSFTEKWLNLFRSLSPYLMTIGLIMCEILAATYALQETRLSMIFEAVALVIGGIQSISAYQNMRWKTNTVGQVNSKFQKIVDRGHLQLKY